MVSTLQLTRDGEHTTGYRVSASRDSLDPDLDHDIRDSLDPDLDHANRDSLDPDLDQASWDSRDPDLDEGLGKL